MTKPMPTMLSNDKFNGAIMTLFSKLQVSQQPLGKKFEEALFENLESLYTECIEE